MGRARLGQAEAREARDAGEPFPEDPLIVSGGPVSGLLGKARDFRDRKQPEAEGPAHLRFLESMDRINQAIQKTNDLKQMLNGVLDTTLDVFDCDRAWLIYPCDPAAAVWKVFMERTRSGYPGACERGMDVPMDPQAAMVCRTVTELEEPVTFGPAPGHPLPEGAERCGVQSMMVVMLRPKGPGGTWAFGRHQCSFPRVWTPDEGRLFKEVGRRLTDALTNLLIYRDLRENELRQREMFNNTSDCLFVLDVTADGRFRFAEFNPRRRRRSVTPAKS
jgi:GAF domain-containing protein